MEPTGKVRQRQPLRLVVLGMVVCALLITGLILYFRSSVEGHKAGQPVRIVFKNNSAYLLYFVARDKGFFQESGLEIKATEMESTNLMIQALASGQADFQPSASVPTLYSAEQNSPGTFAFLYIMLMQRGRNNDAIIVRRDSQFGELSDLEGRRLGAQPGATSLILLKLIFEDVGVEPDRVSIQEMEPRALLQALAARQVDAVFALEPLITQGKEKGISKTLVAEPIEQHVMDPIPIAGGVVTKKFAKDNPETVRRLMQAMEKAIDFTRENEAESRLIMAKAIGMPDGTAQRLGVNTYWKIREVKPDAVQRLSDLFLAHGALERSVDTRSMYLRFD